MIMMMMGHTEHGDNDDDGDDKDSDETTTWTTTIGDTDWRPQGFRVEGLIDCS